MLQPILKPFSCLRSTTVHERIEANETPEIGLEDLSKAARDFMPTRETTMIRYMELLAIFEASNRRLLPERLQNLELSELHRQLADVRSSLHQESLRV